jgi:cellulose synthase/poly-beta-1,6-N-acetylglucosamine synthase-like glycosyltransferase
MSAEVSVIIPVGAVDAELEEQLNAVVTQAVEAEVEVVLSLNSPGAMARQELERMLTGVGDPRIRIVDSSDVRSASHARNVGVTAANGDVLVFCDGDDVVAEGWLAALLDGLGDNGAVSGHYDESRFVPPSQAHWRPPATPGALPRFLGHPYLVSGNLAMTRKAFDAVGGFDTTLTRGEDIAMSWDIVDAGFTIDYVADAVLYYRHRAGLWPMLRQHYLYGRGMGEVLIRHGRPGETGSSGASLLKANRASSTRRSIPGFLRRVAIACGRVTAIVAERRRPTRSA